MPRQLSQKLALFLLSIGLIAYELDIMRVFSVTSWSNFGSMVISIALLGYGLAGIVLTFVQKQVAEKSDKWLSATAMILPISMALAYATAQQIPFNPILIVSDKTQILWIGLYYLLYAVPFFVGALFIGTAFIHLHKQVHGLYFWNMAGSGIGGFLLLIWMFYLPPDKLIFPVLLISGIGLITLQLGRDQQSFEDYLRPLGLAVVILVGSLLIAGFGGRLRVSPFKAVSQDKAAFSDLELKYHEYSPLGVMEVYSSSKYHAAPGLSDNTIFYIDEMPKDAYWGLYLDGNGPINIMRKLNTKEARYMDFLPMSAPYQILKNPAVLLLRIGGGYSTFTALHNGAREITIIEPNERIIRMLKNSQAIKEFTGNFLENPQINLVVNEPRAYTAKTLKKFDLVEISLIDSVGLSQSVGNSLDENYIYTTNAVQDYLQCLHPDGLLSITTWNHLSPPRNVPKLLATVATALKEQGIPHPENRVFVFDLIYSTATILVKNSDFSEEEIEKLKRYCYIMSFEPLYYPGIPEKGIDFNQQLQSLWAKYAAPTTLSKYQAGLVSSQSATPLLTEESRQNSLKNYSSEDLYYSVLKWIFSGKERELYKKYLFDIHPATDDRPYYSMYLKPDSIGIFMDKLDAISEEWSYLLIMGTLIQSIIFGIILVIIPVIGSRKTIFYKTKGLGGIILYYSALGLGYMLIEIFLIQKLLFFLSNPVYSVSVVITSMLVISGLGSLSSQRVRLSPVKKIGFAVMGITLSILFYLYLLSPLLNAGLSLPLLVKMLIAFLVIAPSAFFMGIPFPTGLMHLSENRKKLLPWAWGMNGAFSVTGAMAAKVLSIHYGFSSVLWFAILLYLLVALVFKVNLIRENA